jgi:ABC-2 type transport system ATP-binding protein
MSATPLLSARGVHKSFGARRVLRGADLEVAAGERVVILGENGSGKSTLLQILAGVIAPDDGKVEVNGEIGFAPEAPDLPDHLLVSEWIDVVASLKRLRRRESVRFGVDRMSRMKLGALSLGMRQRVSLAAAWLGDPAILLLDEPTNAIDVETRAVLLQELAGRTAVIATHDRDFAREAATRVATVEVEGAK